jgi:hypothetical protein
MQSDKAQRRKDVRTVVIVTALIGAVLAPGYFAIERAAPEEPTVQQVDTGGPNSDYERCIADDGCLRDLLEFTERDK